ncbi:uncharacterized protein DUF1876 [Kribbella sp. VKM Ac-2527]|jgi:hypothetical protein|uniref:Uncharacterized protein DUF1876 n=1 Tax=Kribbella caucasensis TaxID=2512215 RepID=A0A4R6KDL5_9ACTN|nr:DUF1876 domain-containing protein [Kribbella sp. VKM Ac-2527]TDO48442.1 uncharacterized protein DUF1876 [Kribbella sp. VKM Ac-2527]
MGASREWSVDIFIDEHEEDRVTRAEARLHKDSESELVGQGTAHRHPDDVEVAEIGDELAVARALANLSHELIHAAATDIEQITKRRVHLRS